MSLKGLSDYHMHTTLCGHAVGSIDEYVEHAIALGLDEIGFSEHIYLYHLPAEQRDPELAPREEEMETYVRLVEDARGRYPEISIRLGLEADYIPGHEEKLGSILQLFPFDYVYGSVHFIDGWGFDDSRYIAGYANWDINKLYARYFGLVMDAAETGLFDIMSHLDLVKKFGYRTGSDLSGLYEEVAQKLAKAVVAIEVSSAGLRVVAEEIYPHSDLLDACRQAGVPATIGSDSHKPEHVGYAFPQLVGALRDAGYTAYLRFKGRERTLYPLPAVEK